MLRNRFRASVSVCAILVAASGVCFARGHKANKEIEVFNQRYTSAILHMSNAETMALWADDGTTLLPGMAPISGKQNIAKWLDGVTAKMPGWRVVKQDDDFHDIQVSGDWASEWGTTVQVAQPPDGKPPLEIHGKVLLVLHREKGSAWKIKQEMWTPGPKA